MNYAARQEKLRAVLEEKRLAGLIVSHPLNIAYLTGFRGSAGIALIGPDDSILWIDPRYTLQARATAVGVTVRESKAGLLPAAASWLAKRRFGPVGFDDSNLSAREFEILKKHGQRKVTFRPSGGIVENLRMIKDHAELGKIRAAGRVTAESLEEIIPEIHPGVSEADLAAEIEYRMRRKGAEGVAFESIVASGSRGALPHARPTRKLLEKCELLIIDVGAIVDGYAADMTRTMFLGRPDKKVKHLYGAVLEAEEQGVEAAREGVCAAVVDSVTRKVLRAHGLDRYFTHSTGHGVGMEVHERPRLGKKEKSRLASGCVVTVEPGIYLENLGGIRIEDTVIVGPEGAEIVTPASKTNWILD